MNNENEENELSKKEKKIRLKERTSEGEGSSKISNKNYEKHLENLK